MLIVGLIFLVYSILYAQPELQAWEWVVDGRRIFAVPWNTINHVAIAIAGTCTYDWYEMYSNSDEKNGWGARILPMGSLLFALAWLIDYIEPAEHYDATTALSMIAIATSQFILFIFYAFQYVDFRITPLTTMGRNLLFSFILTGIWDPFLKGTFTKAPLLANPWLALVIVGVIPIFVQWMVAWILQENNILIKF